MYRKCYRISCERCINTVGWRYRPDTTPKIDETFSCEVNGKNGQERNCTTVKPAALQSVTVSPLTTEFNVTQGKTLGNITCSAVCWPICTFKWIGPNYFNKVGTELTLDVISKSRSGKYWCQAKNVIGTQNSKNITTTVQYGPETINVSPRTRSDTYTRTEGGSISNITCSADCYPVCKYTWTYPDNTTLPRSYFYEYALEKIHDGVYTCKAFNEVGYKEKSITVIVNSTDLGTTMQHGLNTLTLLHGIKDHSSIRYTGSFDVLSENIPTILCTRNIQLSPNSTSIIIQENNRFSINCTANCRPQCQHQWTGQTYWSSSNKQLLIRYVKRKDSGSYRCAARNNVGYEYSSFVLVTVHSRPTKVKTITVKSTGSTTASIAWIPDMTVVPGQNFTLHYKTRNDIDFTSVHFKEPENQQNIYLLYVKSLIPSTEYVFKISSENYLGQTESTEVRCVTRGNNERNLDNKTLFLGHLIDKSSLPMQEKILISRAMP
ncbi:unnamed protein product [Mytilus coruscus]|uniref:HMCN n=1 Tax=Mytilus coruscus TaxID=42192 RepID=A0A6J8C115_MYTCO|nr:unnamed protein product [Mytilus coruscus]